jgi:hypothetical protein
MSENVVIFFALILFALALWVKFCVLRFIFRLLIKTFIRGPAGVWDRLKTIKDETVFFFNRPCTLTDIFLALAVGALLSGMVVKLLSSHSTIPSNQEECLWQAAKDSKTNAQMQSMEEVCFSKFKGKH